MPIDNNLAVSVLGLYLLALAVLGWIGYRRGANDEEDTDHTNPNCHWELSENGKDDDL